MLENLFEWNEVPLPDDCEIKISPSLAWKFYDNPSQWYKETVLKEPSDFKGSTSSVLGTVCHKIYECMSNNIEINRDMINEQLDQYQSKFNNPDVDVEEVKRLYPLVANAVLSGYLKGHIPTKTETPLSAKIGDGIYLAGTCDNLTGTCVVDYKNVGTKPNETAIPPMYKRQLMLYAYMFRHNGSLVDTVRIVYGVRPTKTLPARCFVVTEAITEQDWIDTQNYLKLVVETIKAVKEYPNLAHVIFKDYNLKK